jgi:hypothetical protein
MLCPELRISGEARMGCKSMIRKGRADRSEKGGAMLPGKWMSAVENAAAEAKEACKQRVG